MKQRQALAEQLEPSPIRQQIQRLVSNMDQQIEQMKHLTPAQRSGYIVSRNLVSQAITEWGYANRRLKKQEGKKEKGRSIMTKAEQAQSCSMLPIIDAGGGSVSPHGEGRRSIHTHTLRRNA